jgi:hypothetical protein
LHEKKMWLLGQIESAYRRRKDDGSLATIARWRLSQQQPS